MFTIIRFYTFWMLGALVGFAPLNQGAQGLIVEKSSDSSPTLERAASQSYCGMCDASAAVAIDSHRFVVASDEDNVLRLFDRDKPGFPVQTFDFNSPLNLDLKTPETDVEGGTVVGDRIYWISSHARNREGKSRSNRARFFSTKITHTGDRVQLTLIGRPYTRLIQDLANAPELQTLNLGAASQLDARSNGGLNIEALCSLPNGDLLIGFRNPVPRGKALLVPLKNPADLVDGKRARFGAPLLIDLEGFGIRDIAFANDQFWILAGSFDGSDRHGVFTWKGAGTAPVKLRSLHIKDLNPEAMVIYPENKIADVQILSDDGSRKKGGGRCKDLIDPAAKKFRSVLFQIVSEQSQSANADK
jgi:hypothetical protein